MVFIVIIVEPLYVSKSISFQAARNLAGFRPSSADSQSESLVKVSTRRNKTPSESFLQAQLSYTKPESLDYDRINDLILDKNSMDFEAVPGAPVRQVYTPE